MLISENIKKTPSNFFQTIRKSGEITISQKKKKYSVNESLFQIYIIEYAYIYIIVPLLLISLKRYNDWTTSPAVVLEFSKNVISSLPFSLASVAYKKNLEYLDSLFFLKKKEK